MRKTEGVKILGPKITYIFYADDGLILAKEKAERSIEIIREIGGNMTSNSMNEKVNVSYLTRRKNAKK